MQKDKQFKKGPWSIEEISCLLDYYEVEGIAIRERLNRSDTSIYRQAAKIGLRRGQQRNTFSPEEIELLSSKKSIAELSSLMPNHTLNSICSKRGDLGVSAGSKRWAVYEEEIMRKYYPEEGYSIRKRLPDRTVDAIGMKALKMGLKVKK